MCNIMRELYFWFWRFEYNWWLNLHWCTYLPMELLWMGLRKYRKMLICLDIFQWCNSKGWHSVGIEGIEARNGWDFSNRISRIFQIYIWSDRWQCFFGGPIGYKNVYLYQHILFWILLTHYLFLFCGRRWCLLY